MASILTKSPLRLGSDGTGTIVADGHGIGGYLWTAELIDGDGAIEAEAPKPRQAIGGGAEVTFRVELASTSGKVRLHYRRPWDDDDAETATITVKR